MKRKGILLVISMMCLALFTGCSSNADTMPAPTNTTAPTTSAPMNTAGPTESTSPMATTGLDNMMTNAVDSMTPDAMTESGINSVEDARRVSDRVTDEVEKLSELDDAEAVVAGNIALVGISYETQYQGGLTDRLKQMVTERVEMIDKAITAVHVTDEEDQVIKISRLREKLEAGDITFEELQTQMLDIGSSITGGGSPDVSQPQSNTGA